MSLRSVVKTWKIAQIAHNCTTGIRVEKRRGRNGLNDLNVRWSDGERNVSIEIVLPVSDDVLMRIFPRQDHFTHLFTQIPINLIICLFDEQMTKNRR